MAGRHGSDVNSPVNFPVSSLSVSYHLTIKEE